MGLQTSAHLRDIRVVATHVYDEKERERCIVLEENCEKQVLWCRDHTLFANLHPKQPLPL
jgi:hypothetical protein